MYIACQAKFWIAPRHPLQDEVKRSELPNFAFIVFVTKPFFHYLKLTRIQTIDFWHDTSWKISKKNPLAVVLFFEIFAFISLFVTRCISDSIAMTFLSIAFYFITLKLNRNIGSTKRWMARVGGELGMKCYRCDFWSVIYLLSIWRAPRHPLDDQEELKRNLSSSSKILSFSA